MESRANDFTNGSFSRNDCCLYSLVLDESLNLIRMLRFLLRIFAIPLRGLVQTRLILFVDVNPSSGSNVYALYAAWTKIAHPAFVYKIIRGKPRDRREALARHWLWLRASWVVHSHGGRPRYPGQKIIELWHGIPIKNIGLMDPGSQSRGLLEKNRNLQPTIAASSSRMYEVLMSATRCIPTDRYVRSGFPRLRWLQKDRVASRRLIVDLLGLELREETKVICWMPTHRVEKSAAGSPSRSIFHTQLMEYISARVAHALEKLDIYIIVKAHPAERRVLAEIDVPLYSRVLLINEDELRDKAEDFYELLPGFDGLLTDYSSVYLDFLLLDKPIGFLLSDLEAYQKVRGFLFEPIQPWMPGQKLHSSADLLEFLHCLVTNQDIYKDARASVRQQFYPDGLTDAAGVLLNRLLAIENKAAK